MRMNLIKASFSSWLAVFQSVSRASRAHVVDTDRIVAMSSNPVSASCAPVLQVHGLTKRYGERVIVDGLSFALRRGECYGLLGPNGAGKTTTLRALLGLTPFDDGAVEVLGHAVPAQARQARARLGVVPQLDNLDPDFTVAENLLVFGRYFGLSDAQVRARLPQLLAFAALAAKADARIGELSGGMKRRLTLARALINDPDLIIMDEPTTGLDPQARHLIWERLKALLARGKTILLTTHFMDEAERLCHRLGVIDHGRLITEGAPRALIERCLEPQVVEVYGDDLHAWLAAHRAALPARVEVSGETAFCHTDDATPIVQALQGWPDLRYLHRPANLEDLFLRLTGRGMREDA
ncbi:nodulation ATP-binding protein I [Bordetella bronchiseptica CA90 BB1334]|nr:nodulation ATP-binding protein I [Bordetella bronchiseptica OSU054]KAK77270.1 nodulation ATP-binding protein I [Bordetella bronchiseptica CA90 BB02]KDB80305.1 nodulation ATP-binding protein I [Bordetella bronchiseptica CA90 BB1334]KDC18176.1 nodulation ATP-binding protein I [Bordetella bronchiseptica F-1]KDC24841.1 nodulation ATP-binding protein I [Bordetella bronchiseptica F2]KDC31227.1 nodulation ATP-binding protein I [Bordetella bronchiseptica F4563]KDD89203.1 nodulation ATP-binding pro